VNEETRRHIVARLRSTAGHLTAVARSAKIFSTAGT